MSELTRFVVLSRGAHLYVGRIDYQSRILGLSHWRHLLIRTAISSRGA